MFLSGSIEDRKNLLWIGYGCDIRIVYVTVPVNYLLDNYVLKSGALQWLLGEEAANIDLSFLSFIMFIAIIAAMVQLVEMIVENSHPHYTINWVFSCH